MSSHQRIAGWGKTSIQVWQSCVWVTHTCVREHTHTDDTISPHTPHSGNLLCSWRNVDQMAYIPLLSPDWGSHPSPPSSSVQALTGNVDIPRGQRATFYELSVSYTSPKKKKTFKNAREIHFNICLIRQISVEVHSCDGRSVLSSTEL